MTTCPTCSLFSDDCLCSFADMAEATMFDTCEIWRRTTGATDDYGYPAEAWALVSVTACGINETPKQEALGSTEVSMIDAKMRLPLDLDGTFDNTDRLKVIRRYGTDLVDLARTYDIISGPKRGPSALTVNLKLVTDGSDNV